MKKYTSDHDGKSKTASGVDQEHYPEQDEVENQAEPGTTGEEEDVKPTRKSRGEVQGTPRPSGSVQH